MFVKDHFLPEYTIHLLLLQRPPLSNFKNLLSKKVFPPTPPLELYVKRTMWQRRSTAIFATEW